MISPTLRQSFQSNSPAQSLNVVFLAGVQPSDISYRHIVLITLDPFNVISGFHLAFALN
jgi:hypothetical protein